MSAFSLIKIDKLLHWILSEERHNNSIFGIPRELFFVPKENDPFRMEKYGDLLETPLGVAAGPHTQLAQNIICAWLTGSCYIELKTVQTLDSIEVSKPCIDMPDEGYNCEWSQELTLEESYDQYLNAWILIHLLKYKFGYPEPFGCIFNMSIGYNLEGILKPNVQTFIEKMLNCEKEKNEKIELLSKLYPEIKDIKIPNTISNNVTLSTMHGCPPDEIEKISRYLIEKRKLHTTIKLNPTLLGKEKVHEILNEKLGFITIIPDSAFEHDLKYNDALKIINSLLRSAQESETEFTVKLTNTLECLNSKNIFSKKEKTMYMSGRALHPLSINLACVLQNQFSGELNLSFSAGADCFNISDIISCGIKPVTVCSDLLKPGGYSRQLQYIQNLRKEFINTGGRSIDDFIINKNSCLEENIKKTALVNLNNYAPKTFKSKLYKKTFYYGETIKSERILDRFDCIKAPCVCACADEQEIPQYLYHASNGEYKNALTVILRTNPFPSVLGMVCDHLCQTKCTRMNYDNPILIREIKRFITEKTDVISLRPEFQNDKKVAIIGAGPSGLSCAFYLALEGFSINVYESKGFTGGMVSDAIPAFRLSYLSIKKDIERIRELGVNIIANYKISQISDFEDLRKNNDFIFIAIGAQKNKKLGIKGEDSANVLNCLSFLSDIRRGKIVRLGKKIAIIGGGNSAIDAARTAVRLVDTDSEVILLYRRTKKEMPAAKEEVQALLSEGIKLYELTVPTEIISGNDKSLSLVCCKMKLGEPDSSGRPRPEKIEGSEFEIKIDTIITAIGQEMNLDFIDKENFKISYSSHETNLENVFIGGDAYRGASTLVNAVADGRKVAEKIIEKCFKKNKSYGINTKDIPNIDYQKKRAERILGIEITEDLPISKDDFSLMVKTLTEEEAKFEAGRCLFCDEICDICVSVCPNRANISYKVNPRKYPVYMAIKNNENIELRVIETILIDQVHQVLNIADFCNECGNCTTFCPTSGKPFKDKPKFFLSEDLFQKSESGYRIEKENGIYSIRFKKDNRTEKLSFLEELFVFETDEILCKFNFDDFSVQEIIFKNDSLTKVSLLNAIHMRILLMALKDFYSII